MIELALIELALSKFDHFRAGVSSVPDQSVKIESALMIEFAQGQFDHFHLGDRWGAAPAADRVAQGHEKSAPEGA